MENEVCKYRPCNVRSVSICVTTFMLFFISLVGILPFVKEKIIALLIAGVFFLLNVLFSLYSLFKLNSFVFLDETKISQKQYGKVVEINYDTINYIKLSFVFYTKAPYLVKLYSKNKTISFEITSAVLDKFMNHCTSFEIKNRLTFLLKDKGVYD